MRTQQHSVPSKLFKPMWLRSRESLTDNGVIYDPMAAAACQGCVMQPECDWHNLDQTQLLYATLTSQCDAIVKQFLAQHPTAWIINVGGGLDTRFYRLDNGRCRWLEVDVDETLLWRERLFHTSERFRMVQGSVKQLDWLAQLAVPAGHPTMLICDQALLECTNQEISAFCQYISRYFPQVEACLVLAGDKCHSRIGQKLGCESYQHGFADPRMAIIQALPWACRVEEHSPLDKPCPRWRFWQRALAAMPRYRLRFTPMVLHIEI
ncbi:class I SAM-dependent methyltransferase [Salinivibrio sp. AR640]|uniref:class I SAM-dependent methyltransferase n=1 Tax=Salinivibrio sp. AR640 TaxID=1909437 RepID=UPI003082C1E9